MGIDSFLPESLRLPVMGALAGLFVLSQAARRYPHVEWLQKFHLRDHRTEQQKERARRSGNIMAGIQMILLGIAIPVVYPLLSMMLFREMTRVELIVVIATSVLLIGGGLFAVAKARTAR